MVGLLAPGGDRLQREEMAGPSGSGSRGAGQGGGLPEDIPTSLTRDGRAGEGGLRHGTGRARNPGDDAESPAELLAHGCPHS